jgi:hypothetical protein
VATRSERLAEAVSMSGERLAETQLSSRTWLSLHARHTILITDVACWIASGPVLHSTGRDDIRIERVPLSSMGGVTVFLANAWLWALLRRARPRTTLVTLTLPVEGRRRTLIGLSTCRTH